MELSSCKYGINLFRTRPPEMIKKTDLSYNPPQSIVSFCIAYVSWWTILIILLNVKKQHNNENK